MKKLLCLLVILSLLLCGCGGSASSVESVEPEFTEEELFLQNAYWYLQSDEKEIFSWENGVLDDYYAEESRKIISPEGETEIQGMDLRRVKYVVWQVEGMLTDTINLYFQKDGTFVGTDGSRFWEGQPEEPRNMRYWDGDLSMWLFPPGPELSGEEPWTFSCVLRKNTQGIRTFQAYAGHFTELEFFREGESITGGIDASAQELEMKEGTVLVDKLQWTPEFLEVCGIESGSYTVRAVVKLNEVNRTGKQSGVEWSLVKHCDIFVT